MSDKKPKNTVRGTKHGLAELVSKIGQNMNKKRKIVELTIDQHLAPGLRDSSFGQLTEEVMFDILGYLSLNDLSLMSLASKAMSKVIFAYAMAGPLAHLIARQIIDCPYSELLDQSIAVGRLLKRTSFLFPVQVRLKFFHQYTEKVQRWATNELGAPIDTLTFLGSALHTFIAGWDEGECLKVFTFMSENLFLYRSISRFASDAPGTDVENEIFLRRHLRYLFLDKCISDYDRAVWIGFISNQIGTAQLARMILLLYGPINASGKIDWNFALNIQAFKQHTNIFITLAKVIGILHLIPNWSPFLSLEVLVYVSNVPNCWLLRSFSSLLLPLSCIDKDLVVEYFAILYKTGRASTASLLMALTLMVSPQFISHSGNGITIENKSVHQFILNVINSPRLSLERYFVVKKLWNAVLSLADDFTETAIQDFDNAEEGVEDSDAIDDFHDLVDAWKELTVILMSD